MTPSRLALALLLAPSPALPQPRPAPVNPAPAITLDEVLRRFRTVPGISARFRESRQMALLAAPLVSEGTLHYAPPGRLVRRTESPELAVALLEGNRLRFRDASGEQSLDLDALPAARQFLESFTALVAGDRAALARSYDLEFAPQGAAAWRLTMRPRVPALSRVFRAVEVAGEGVALRTLVVREVSGDVSETTFTEVRTDRRFTAEEAARVFRLSP